MDAKLPWPQRMAVRIHLLYCVWCRRYAAQVRFLRRATRQYTDRLDDAADAKLSGEARQRIQAKLRKFSEPPPSD